MTEIQRPNLAAVPNTPPRPAPRQTVWQQNAEAFATTAPSAIDQERHVGVRRTLGYLEQGMRGRAHYELVRSVIRQARIAGLGDVPITEPCPCGGRCHQ